MKKIVLLTSFAWYGITATAQDPVTAIIKAGVKKAIVALDLKIQRLQTKTIWLQNAQKVIENAMSKLKLDEITGWVQKQKDLYQNYFDELWKVKDVLSASRQVKDIIQQQFDLVKQYHISWNGVKQDRHFNADELNYIGQVYTGIIAESVKNLDQVALVINSFTTQMSDSKRMEIISIAADAMQKNYDELKQFNTQNILVSIQRSKDEHDMSVVKQLYGIQ